MRMRWIAAAAALALVVAGCGGGKGPGTPGTPDKNYQGQQAQTQNQNQQKPAPKQWDKPPAMQIDQNKQYFATIQTNLGDIRVELWPKEAPKAVNNFVFLAREKFYDGVVFHRIIKGFMIQGGDPLGNGTGGPGYRFEEEIPAKKSYEPGILAMARTMQPNSQGSQFFICNGPSCKNLDQSPIYTQFGKVVSGMDVVEKLSSLPVVAGGEQTPSKPVTPPVIKTIVIEEK